jgi:hypothetical protein
VSAERTPINLLVDQKDGSPSHSLLVRKRVSNVADCNNVEALFAAPLQSPPHTPQRDSSRRGSLSSLIGPASHRPSFDSVHSTLSSENPLEESPAASLSHHPSAEEEMNSDSINRFRSEHFAPRPQPARFDELARGDSRSYGDLENLLLSRIESFAEFNYLEEGAASYDTANGTDTGIGTDTEEDDPMGLERNRGEDCDKQPLPDNEWKKKPGLNLSVKEKRFRLNDEGQLLVEEKGEFVQARKNFSLYYDMITDKELRAIADSYHHSGSADSHHRLYSSSAFASHSHHTSLWQHETLTHELTGADMLSPARCHHDLWTATHRLAQEKKEKEDLLEKHHDFVETLCRITELKSQTAMIERNSQNKRNRKKTGRGTGDSGLSPGHSHATNPYHQSFGLIFDGL